uniref:Uncharacterized protein n=1 Tax=Cannabis sativa TaxID=3483 RepID=A0A803RA89_CANSA
MHSLDFPKRKAFTVLCTWRTTTDSGCKRFASFNLLLIIIVIISFIKFYISEYFGLTIKVHEKI